jgi:hypothetical protein
MTPASCFDSCDLSVLYIAVANRNTNGNGDLYTFTDCFRRKIFGFRIKPACIRNNRTKLFFGFKKVGINNMPYIRYFNYLFVIHFI